MREVVRPRGRCRGSADTLPLHRPGARRRTNRHRPPLLRRHGALSLRSARAREASLYFASRWHGVHLRREMGWVVRERRDVRVLRYRVRHIRKCETPRAYARLAAALPPGSKTPWNREPPQGVAGVTGGDARVSFGGGRRPILRPAVALEAIVLTGEERGV